MSKKVKNLIAVLGILAVCIIVYFVILAAAKKKPEDGNGSSGEAPFWSFGDESITELTIETAAGSFAFSYNVSNGVWTYPADADFPVYQDVFSILASKLKDMTCIRTVKNVTDMKAYGLDSPALKISFKTSGGNGKTLLVSGTAGADNTCYFTEEGSDSVCLTATTLSSYSEYDLYSCMQKVEIPDFTSYELNSVEFRNKTDETYRYLILSVDNEAAQTDAADIVFKYSENEAYKDDELLPAAVSDTRIMLNYINEFVFNKAVAHKPSDSELESYGLLLPQAEVKIKFTEKKAAANTASPAADDFLSENNYEYTISVGNPVSPEASQYYVRVGCKLNGNDENEYNSAAVYTTNAIYAEYYINMCADEINGVNSEKEQLLANNELPVITADNLDEIIIETADKGKIIIVNKGNGELEFSNGQEADAVFPVASTAGRQLFEYLSASGSFKYGSRISDSKTKEKLAQYGLDNPVKIFTFAFTGTVYNEDGSSEEHRAEWVLSIGKADGSFYVTADNTDSIYSMPESMINYLMALNDEILTGDKIYGQTDIDKLD